MNKMTKWWIITVVGCGLIWWIAGDLLNDALVWFGLPTGATYPVMALCCALHVAWYLKRLLVRAVPKEASFRPANIDSFESLDRSAVDRLSSELQALGFVHLADLESSGTIGRIAIRGFDRVLVHPEHGCHVSIGQLLQPLLPLDWSISTHFDDGVSYTTRDHVTTAAGWTNRLPKHLWSDSPGASTSELVRIHLETRNRLSDQLGLRVRPLDSAEEFSSCNQQCLEDLRKNTSSRYSLAVLDDYLDFTLRPKHEWFGKVLKRPQA